MTPDDVAQPLHDQATRGKVLSPEERVLLEAWYAEQDQAESAVLAKAFPHPTLAALQAQVDSTLTQLLAATSRIQTLAAENEDLRREVLALQRQLLRKPLAQPT